MANAIRTDRLLDVETHRDGTTTLSFESSPDVTYVTLSMESACKVIAALGEALYVNLPSEV